MLLQIDELIYNLPAVRTEFDEFDHVPVPRLANVLDGKQFCISLVKGMLLQMTKLDGSEVIKRGSGKVDLISQC